MKQLFMQLFFSIVFSLVSCSSSKQIIKIPESNPKVSVKLTLRDKSIPQELDKYQIRLDSFLILASRTKMFIAVPHNESSNIADYEIKISIDSLYLVSPEIQKTKLSLKDSVFTALMKRQKNYDSTYKPASDLEKAFIVMGILGSFKHPAQNLLDLKNTIQSDFTNYDDPYPKLTYSDKKKIKKIKFNPLILGTIAMRSIKVDTVLYVKKFELEDEYDRYVDYNEQIDMLLRWLLGKIRFSYDVPFISDSSKVLITTN